MVKRQGQMDPGTVTKEEIEQERARNRPPVVKLPWWKRIPTWVFYAASGLLLVILALVLL